MKQSKHKKISSWLRVGRLGLMLAISTGLLFSFSVSKKLGDDVWQQLGLSKADGTDAVKNSFLNGYLYYYNARNIKNIGAGNRAAVAKDLLAYTKQYINSEAFKKEYELMRKNAKPQPSSFKARDKESIRKEKIAEAQKSIKETEENMKQWNADMQKAVQPVLDMQKKNLKDYQDPKSEVIELLYQSEKMQEEQNAQYYTEQLKQWETDFPADYKQLVKARLQKYLSLLATVDFNAELTEKNGRKKFVNPAYEAKPSVWKMIFRAGKDVNDVTRSFAEQWLKEL